MQDLSAITITIPQNIIAPQLVSEVCFGELGWLIDFVLGGIGRIFLFELLSDEDSAPEFLNDSSAI